MKHLLWGILSLSIGIFMLVSILLLAKVSVSVYIYSGLFIPYGIYRLKQYAKAKMEKRGA